jgi:hypothetical protein
MPTTLSRRSLLSAPLLAHGAAVGSRPNVVFVLVDDLRWDELGCAGHPFASTPHADRLAREGANFRNAFELRHSAHRHAQHFQPAHIPTRMALSKTSHGKLWAIDGSLGHGFCTTRGIELRL